MIVNFDWYLDRINGLIEKIPPAVYLSVRLLFGAWFIWLCHVIGYVDQPGTGVNGLVGREVSTDLFFEFLSAAVGASILAIPLTYLVFITSNSKLAFKLGVPSSVANTAIVYGSIILLISVFFSYIGFVDATSALSYATSTRTAIICSIALFCSVLMLYFSKKFPPACDCCSNICCWARFFSR